MTYQGGSNNKGTLFEWNPTGHVFTVLKHFNPSTDSGGNPYGSLIESGGKFYGMNSGGAGNNGTLFELNPTGNVFTVLRYFNFSLDGANPRGSLLESGGKFYGMTYRGGSNNKGTLFEWNPTGNVFTVLKHFGLAPDGGNPEGSLIESGGKFYGMTTLGGSIGYGTVFEWNLEGNVFTVLKNLGGADGAIPYYGHLIAVGDADNDGFTVAQGDCDDTDPAVNPGATEACNALDDDCNEIVDDVATCPKPTGLTASNVTATSATVSWAEVPCASGYRRL